MGYDLALDPNRFSMTHARAFSRHPAFQLVAAVDVDANLRSNFEAAYKCNTYSDIEKALSSHAADVVVVALPTPAHSQALSQILAYAKPKIILCEKPLAYDLVDARRMVHACEESGVSLYVNYMRRSDPGVIEVKRRLSAGLITTPVKGCVWYTKGWLHNAGHFFNLMEYWLGSVVAYKVLQARGSAEEGFADLDVWVSFESGEVTFLSAWPDTFSHYDIELFSPNGRLHYASDTCHINWQTTKKSERFADYIMLGDEIEVITMNRDQYQLQVVNQLALSLQGQIAQLCTGADALNTLGNMRNILESTL